MGFFGSIGLGAFGRVTAAQRRANAAANRVHRAQATRNVVSTALPPSDNPTETVHLNRQQIAAQKKADRQSAVQKRKDDAAQKKADRQASKSTSAKVATDGSTPATDDSGQFTIGPPAITGDSGVTLPPPAPNFAPPGGFPGGGFFPGSGGGFAPPPMGGSYGGGMMPGGGYGGGVPPSGGYSIQPPASGYAIGGPQGAPGAYTPTQEVYSSYSMGPQEPDFTMNVPQTSDGTAIGPTPYAGSYSIGAPSGNYGMGSLGQGGIVAYTQAQPGDTRACTNKRTALSKAYQRALKATQKNPKSKAMTSFQKRYPKLVTALQKKCLPSGQPVVGMPGFMNCPTGFQRNPMFQPGFPRGANNPLCVMGLQPNYPPFGGGFTRPPSYYPQGSGPQAGETVWDDGSYEIGVEGTPDTGGGLIPAGFGPAMPEDDVTYSSAVVGPVSGRDSDSIPIQGDDGVTDAIDPAVLAMSETGADDFPETGSAADFESSSFNGLGFIGRSRSERRKPKAIGRGHKRSLPLLAMR